MKFLMHPAILTAAALWFTMLLWMIVNLVRAPVAVEGRRGFRLERRR